MVTCKSRRSPKIARSRITQEQISKTRYTIQRKASYVLWCSPSPTMHRVMRSCSFLSSFTMADKAAAPMKTVTRKPQMLRESSWVYDKLTSPSGVQFIAVTGGTRSWADLWVSSVGIPAAERDKDHTGAFAIVIPPVWYQSLTHISAL